MTTTRTRVLVERSKAPPLIATSAIAINGENRSPCKSFLDRDGNHDRGNFLLSCEYYPLYTYYFCGCVVAQQKGTNIFTCFIYISWWMQSCIAVLYLFLLLTYMLFQNPCPIAIVVLKSQAASMALVLATGVLTSRLPMMQLRKRRLSTRRMRVPLQLPLYVKLEHAFGGGEWSVFCGL